MSFTLLKEINDRTLTKLVVIPAEPVQVSEAEALAASIIESMGADSFQVTPDDYSRWLEVIIDVAEQEGVPIGRKNQFMDVALDFILDNDPKIDGLGSDDPEALKMKIANTLWQTYKASKAHSAVSTDVSKVISQAREEEEVFAALAQEDEALTHGRHVEVNVHDRWYPGMLVSQRGPNGKYTVRIKLRDGNRDLLVDPENIRPESHQDEESGFAQVWNVAKGVENEEGGGGESSGESSTTNSFTIVGSSGACPYPLGTLRAALWHDYNVPKTQAKNFAKPSRKGAEDEQIAKSPDDVDPSQMYADDEDFGQQVEMGASAANADESAEDIAARITGGGGDTDSRLEDLENRLNDLEQSVSSASEVPDDQLDIDYDSLGTDRGGAAEVIGVSVPASSEAEDDQTDLDPFRQAITSPSDLLSQAVRAVEDEGASAWKSMVLPKNPHPKDSKAHKAWEKGMKSAAQSAFGFQQKPKEKVVKKPTRK